MSDSTANLMSDAQRETSFVAEMGVSPIYHFSPLSHNRMDLEVISLSDDFASEKAYG